MLVLSLVVAPLFMALLLACSSRHDAAASLRLALVGSGVLLVQGLLLLAAVPVQMATMPLVKLWGTDALIDLSLRADGISAWIALLVCILVPVAIIASYRALGDEIRNLAIGVFTCAAMLFGVLFASDLVVFYCFYEAMLVPVLILIFAYGDTDRRDACLRFVVYTMLFSAFLLIGIWSIAAACGTTAIDALGAPLAAIDPTTRQWLFLAFVLAFAVKVPLIPLHAWQAPVYASAPTGVTILLAGAMAKMGLYGFLRLVLPLFPTESAAWAPVLIGLGIATCVYGALIAVVQTDLKRLLAFASLGHLGLVVVGLFAGHATATAGVLVQIVAHGLSVAAIFTCAGWIEAAHGHRDILRGRGLVTRSPLFAALLLAAGLAVIALPGTAGFLGEFLLVVGSMQSGRLPVWALLVVLLSVIFAAWYMLSAIQQLAYGRADDEAAPPPPGTLEAWTIVLLLAASVALGLHCTPITSALAPDEAGATPAPLAHLETLRD